MFVEYENHFAVEKITKNLWGQFRKYFEKFCCRHQKNASKIISIYGNCKLSIFSDKKFFFFILYDTPKFMPKQEKISSKIRCHHLSKMYEICMISIFS